MTGVGTSPGVGSACFVFVVRISVVSGNVTAIATEPTMAIAIANPSSNTRLTIRVCRCGCSSYWCTRTYPAAGICC